MLEEHKECENRSSNIIKFHNNEFYNAILDEDLEHIKDVWKKHGSDFFIDVQDITLQQVFQKGLPIRPLHLAASYRKVKSMKSLLTAGADPETRDQFGRTTLHLVVTSWPNIHTTNPKPESKFHTAMIGAQRQAVACLQLLCEHGVDINAEMEGDSQTALHLSVRYSALSAVHILASSSANVNAVDSRGMTPLHMAAGMLHKDIISCLIRQGADINMGVENSGNTPLHLAVVAAAMKTTKDNVSSISELLVQGADANAENGAGMTPLQEACSMGNIELIDLLLSYGANIKKLNREGENCLFLFLNNKPNLKNSSVLVKLISLTSPLTIYNKRGHLPSTLMLPCFFKQRDQLLKLIQQPRRLQNICKNHIYLTHIRDKKDKLRDILPTRLYDFVFNNWNNIHNISFVSNDVHDS